jgi:DNA-directed RNA polymerase specialized sigma24 family protein
METMDDTLLGSIDRKLEVIVALLLRLMPAGEELSPLREQINTLSDLGLRPSEIARILGRSQGYVNKELVGLRKRGLKSEQAKED